MVLTVALTLWLLYETAHVRRVAIIELAMKGNISHFDYWIWCSIVATALSFLSRFIFMLSGAGSLPPILYNDRSNEQVLKKLSHEFETRSVKRLTPLDDICFTCLRYKAPHDEHCKDCNACVIGFHFHSKTLGKCVGQQNQRSYGIY